MDIIYYSNTLLLARYPGTSYLMLPVMIMILIPILILILILIKIIIRALEFRRFDRF